MAQFRQPTSKDLVITCVKGEGTLLKFWALPLNALETVKTFENHFHGEQLNLEQTSGFLSCNQTPVGFKCAAYSKIKNAWCRARVVQVISFSDIVVQFIDYGNEEVVSVADVRSLDDGFFRIPPQAVECILADVIPSYATGEWPPEAIRFCEEQLLFQTVSCFVTRHHQKVPEVRIAKKGENDPFVQRLINSGLAFIKLDTLQQAVGYKMNKLDPNTTHLIRISFIQSPQKFFVQLAAAEFELKKLMDEIKQFTTIKENLQMLNAPLVNTPCLAQFSSKQLYYRAIISSVSHGQCSVLFIDYGCTEMKGFEELRVIPSRYLSLQAQAICCTLKPGDIESEECFKAAKFGLLTCHVLDYTGESYIVQLTTHTQEVLPRQIPRVTVSTLMVYQRLKLKVNTTYEVMISYTNDVTEFYCQLVQFKEQLDSLSEILNNRCEYESISLQECVTNLPVCVKFSEDHIWYRALINKVNHEHDIEVFFVDFGNYDNANLRDIRRMKPELMTLPMQAHKSCLFEVESPSEALKDDLFDTFEELTTGQVLGAYIQAVTDGQSYAMTLHEKNSSSPLSINEKIQSKFSSISPITVLDIENLYIMSFSSPDSFFGQFEKLSSSKLEEMQTAINEFYATSLNTSYKPKVGNYVCAKYPVDEQFYRARVENVNGVQCDVLFIDYGNREPIPLKDIHPMNRKFTNYPQFGVECRLESFPPATPVEKLKSLMLENSVQAKMIKEEKNKWKIALTEDFNGNVAILELMRQHEMVIPRSIHGAGLQGYQDASFQRNTSHSTNRTFNEAKIDYQNVQSNHIQPQRNENFSSLNQTPLFSQEASNTKQYTKSFDVISIPLKAYRNVYVSHVVNPSEFYCQIEEESTKLQAMMTSIENIYSNFNDNDFNLDKIIVDSPCCAVFEDDGLWYRGQIREVSSKSCLVYFIDYGNTKSVPITQVKELKREFYSLPPQAIKCKSYNVSPKSGTWSDADIDVFIGMTLEKSFVAQFVECDNKGFYAVNMVSIGKLQEDVLNKEFVTLGHGRLEDASKTIVLNSHAASSNLSFQEPTVKLGCKEAVTVSYGLNPGEIFCQLKSSEEQFKKMMIDLQTYCNKSSSAESLVDRPHQGMICLAQFFMDSAWYRGEIRKVASNSLTVCYVDYGNCESVDKKKIRCITQDFAMLPIQSIKCRLKGIKPPGQSWSVNDCLSKYFEGNVTCRFVEKDKESYVVDMECNGQNIAQQLIRDRLAASDGLIKPDSTFKGPTQRLSANDSSYKREFEPLPAQNDQNISQALTKRNDAFVSGQLLSVVVSFVSSPAKFWCQLLDESELLEQLMADIETKYTESDNSLGGTKLTVGTYCMAKYSVDEAWYRAQIKCCISTSEYEVFFIDYGNSEVTTSSQLAAITSEFLKLPAQCFECQLHRSPSSCDSTKTDEFNTLVTEAEELTAKVEKIVNSIPIISLLLEKEENEVNISDLIFGESSEEVVLSLVGLSYLPPPEIPLGLQEGYVTEVYTPHEFYIQLAGIEDNLAELSAQLSEQCEAEDVPIPKNPAVGCACAAKYLEDNNWYRAEIIALQETSADVLFVDYGNINNVSIDTLKVIDNKFLDVPPYAIKCKLNGITSTGEQWSEGSVNTFRDMVLDCPLGITFISKDIPATVNITKDDKDLGQSLVDQELATVYTCPETDEAYADDHLTTVEDGLHSLPSDLSYPKRKLVSSKLSVKINYADSHNKFYCMPLELSTELDTVMKTLEILYASPAEDSNKCLTDSLECPNPTMSCIAKYSEDEAWYRAVITKVEGSDIYVSFVDYGNSEVTTLENLRAITPELIKIPPIAVECKLSSVQAVEGKEPEIAEKLEQYCVDEIEIEMEVLNSSEPYEVNLYHEEDLADILCRDGLAIKVTPPPENLDPIIRSPSENVKENLQTAFVELPGDLCKSLPSSSLAFGDDAPFSVKYCEIENETVVIYACPCSRDEALSNFVARLQSTYNEIDKRLDHFESMDLCAAKYTEDESWYRAEVLECDSDKIKVNFIDYGNTETVTLNNICQLLPEFLNEPKFSVKFYLSGCRVRNSCNEELQAKLDEILYEDSVFFKICKYAHHVPNVCVMDIICGEVSLVETLVNDKLMSFQYTTNPKLGEEFEATVETVIENVFYLLPVSFAEDRDKLQVHLQKVCCDISACTIEVDPGCLYGAKINDEWSRVQVLVVNSNNDSALVFCVDYGKEVEVKISELVRLPADVCHTPLLLLPCMLTNFGDASCHIKGKEMNEIKKSAFFCEIQKTKSTNYPLQIKFIPNPSVVEDISIPNFCQLAKEFKSEETILDVDTQDTNSVQKESYSAETNYASEEILLPEELSQTTIVDEIPSDSLLNEPEEFNSLDEKADILDNEKEEVITNASVSCDYPDLPPERESDFDSSEELYESDEEVTLEEPEVKVRLPFKADETVEDVLLSEDLTQATLVDEIPSYSSPKDPEEFKNLDEKAVSFDYEKDETIIDVSVSCDYSVVTSIVPQERSNLENSGKEVYESDEEIIFEESEVKERLPFETDETVENVLLSEDLSQTTLVAGIPSNSMLKDTETFNNFYEKADCLDHKKETITDISVLCVGSENISDAVKEETYHVENSGKDGIKSDDKVEESTIEKSNIEKDNKNDDEIEETNLYVNTEELEPKKCLKISDNEDQIKEVITAVDDSEQIVNESSLSLTNKLRVCTDGGIENSISNLLTDTEKSNILPDVLSLDEASECITLASKLTAVKELANVEDEDKLSYAAALAKSSENDIAGILDVDFERLSKETNVQTSLVNEVSENYENGNNVTEATACKKISEYTTEVVDMDIEDLEGESYEPEDEFSSLLPEDARPNNDVSNIYLSDFESLEEARNKEPKSEIFESDTKTEANVCAESDMKVEADVYAESDMKTEVNVCAESDLDLAMQEGVEAMQELVLDECHDARPECDIKQDLEEEATNLSLTEEELEDDRNWESQRTESSSEKQDEISKETNFHAHFVGKPKEMCQDDITEETQVKKFLKSNFLEELMNSTWQHSPGKLKVDITDVFIEAGLVLLTVKLDADELSSALFNVSQEKYSEKSSGLTDSSELNLCVVQLSNEWHRAKITDSTENTLTVLLIDSNRTDTVDISAVKDIEEAHRPQELYLKCELASIFCPHNKTLEAKDFLTSLLKGTDKDIFMELVQSGEPFKINILLDENNILLRLLSQNLVIQRFPKNPIQSGKHSAKVSQLVSKSGHLEMYVNLVSQLDDLQKLKSSMTKTYPLSEKASVVESGVYAVLSDGTWCRGMATSSNESLQLLLVDSGKTVSSDTSVCLLLPQHCVQPPFAILCQFKENIVDVEVLKAISMLGEKEFLIDIQVDCESLDITATVTDEGLIDKISNTANVENKQV